MHYTASKHWSLCTNQHSIHISIYQKTKAEVIKSCNQNLGLRNAGRDTQISGARLPGWMNLVM